MHHVGPFSIPAINNIIPEKWKPWIIIMFVVIFQFSSGLYLATANEMVGATALMQEDILMAGYASLIGMALTFTIMLRLKMRFTTKFAFLVCSIALITSNIICLYTGNVVVLVVTCFFAGIFKMWATFECNSTIQLWLTPKRDLSVFFCFIYLLVQGTILVSGVTNLYVAFFSNYQFMHWFVIGLLLFVMLITLLIFNSNRFRPPFPLFGIDWLGALLWGLIMMTVNFICLYGEHYDWWSSSEVKTAALFLVVLLAMNIYRASFIRHPFIPLQTFKYKAVYIPFVLYIMVDIFLAPSHLIEHIYFDGVLQYDSMHVVSMSLTGWLGVIAGAVFTYFYFAVKKNSYKSTFMIGFGFLIGYLVQMYFLIDANTAKEMLMVPVFTRSFGYVVIAIVLLTNLVKVPFHHFFQAISVQAFISAACGSAVGAAILHHLFNGLATKNFQLISTNIDRVNHQLANLGNAPLEMMIRQQVLLVTSKEVYGYLVIAAMLCFVVFLFYKFPYLPKNVRYPKMKTIRRMLKKEIA